MGAHGKPESHAFQDNRGREIGFSFSQGPKSAGEGKRKPPTSVVRPRRETEEKERGKWRRQQQKSKESSTSDTTWVTRENSGTNSSNSSSDPMESSATPTTPTTRTTPWSERKSSSHLLFSKNAEESSPRARFFSSSTLSISDPSILGFLGFCSSDCFFRDFY